MTIKIEENKLIIDDNYHTFEKKLVKKLLRMARGVTQDHPKEDSCLIIEGKEGKGKTNTSIGCAAFLKASTKRNIHLFFRLGELMQFAKSTEKKIIIWDEPSLDSLSRDQINKMNIDMQRLFMTIRKKRHIFLINYTKFWKFPEYLVVDRANGMIHMKEKKIGRFIYVRKNRLEFLWNEYRTKKKRAYIKAGEFGGVFPIIPEDEWNKIGIQINNIPNASYDDYEREKDEAILSIGEKSKSKKEVLFMERVKIWKIAWYKLLKYFVDQKLITISKGAFVSGAKRREFAEIKSELIGYEEDVGTPLR